MKYYRVKKECDNYCVSSEHTRAKYFHGIQNMMTQYIFCMDGEFYVIEAQDKEDAFIRARLMGFKGEKKQIRIYR